MLKLTGCVCFRVHIGDFLELEGAFQRSAVVNAAANDKDIVANQFRTGGLVLLCQLTDFVLVSENALQLLRQLLQISQQRLEYFRTNGLTNLCKLQSNQIDDSELRGVALGRCNRDFRTCHRVQHVIAFAGDGAANGIDDGQNVHIVCLCLTQCGQCISGLAGLADGDAQIIAAENRTAVTELGCQIHFNRNAGQLLNDVLADHGSVPSRAAGNHVNAADVLDALVAQTQFIQCDFSVMHAGANAGAQRVGLFLDFLHHEVIVTALFCGGNIVIYRIHFVVNRLAIHIHQLHGIRLDERDFVVAQQIILAGMVEYRRNIRCDVIFVFAQTDNHRAVLANCEQGVRIVGAQDAQCIRAADAVQHLDERADQIAVVQIVKQLCDNFGVGLRAEYHAVCL